MHEHYRVVVTPHRPWKEFVTDSVGLGALSKLAALLASVNKPNKLKNEPQDKGNHGELGVDRDCCFVSFVSVDAQALSFVGRDLQQLVNQHH